MRNNAPNVPVAVQLIARNAKARVILGLANGEKIVQIVILVLLLAPNAKVKVLLGWVQVR
jgi:hypothetical protein